MKRIALLVVVATFVCGAIILAQQKTETAEQELLKLEQQCADAWVKSDLAFFDRILADEYTWTSPWGWVSTKADDIALIKSGTDIVSSWVLADMKVRLYGDTAVVTGRDAVKEKYKGMDTSSQNRWTHVWVKRAGRWRCVAAQSSEIESNPGLPTSSLSPEEAVRQADEAWAKAVASKSVDQTVAFYDGEAVTAGSAMPPCQGIGTIRAMWERMFSQPDFSLAWKVDKVIVIGSGAIALSTGIWRMPGPNATGLYFAVWRKLPDDQWKVLMDAAWYGPAQK